MCIFMTIHCYVPTYGYVDDWVKDALWAEAVL